MNFRNNSNDTYSTYKNYDTSYSNLKDSSFAEKEKNIREYDFKKTDFASRYINSPTRHSNSEFLSSNFNSKSKFLGNDRNNGVKRETYNNENIITRQRSISNFRDSNDYTPNNLIYQQVEGSKVRPVSSSNIHYNDKRNLNNSVSPTNSFNYKNSLTPLLPSNNKKNNLKTLILDLDETLVHSAFKPFMTKSDIVLNVELERKMHVIHVLKRPGVEQFLERMSKHYEVVIFTASLSAYANPLIDQLDFKRNVQYRLFREHCTPDDGMYIKDMKKLGRDLKDVIIIDVN